MKESNRILSAELRARSSQAGAFAGPLVLLALLPFGISLIAVLLLFLALSLHRRWPGMAGAVQALLPGAVIGVGISAWAALSFWEGLLAGVVLTAILWGLLASMKLPRDGEEVSGAMPPSGEDIFRQGTTPEGDKLKFLNTDGGDTEGPGPYNVVFPDGVVLARIGDCAQFSRDGRYFMAERTARDGMDLIVLDRHERQVHYVRSREEPPAWREWLDTPAGGTNFIANARASMPEGLARCL